MRKERSKERRRAQFLSQPVTGYVGENTFNYFHVNAFSANSLLIWMNQTSVSGDCDLYVKVREETREREREREREQTEGGQWKEERGEKEPENKEKEGERKVLFSYFLPFFRATTTRLVPRTTIAISLSRQTSPLRSPTPLIARGKRKRKETPR
jgi:hypothetical protein